MPPPITARSKSAILGPFSARDEHDLPDKRAQAMRLTIRLASVDAWPMMQSRLQNNGEDDGVS
jgi:hypothetical protein